MPNPIILRRLRTALLASLWIAFACLNILELGTKLLLARKKVLGGYPLFYSSETLPAAPSTMPFASVDPILGWSRDPIFVQYYSPNIPKADRLDGTVPGKVAPHAKKIVALGGSTTDPGNISFDANSNWVQELTKVCAKGSFRCHALNGGIAGYVSSQELLKLIRDVVPLKPNIVISLNGINDVTNFLVSGNSFTNAHQMREMQLITEYQESHLSPLYAPPSISGFYPNARFAYQLFAYNFFAGSRERVLPNFGIHDEFTPSERWEHNVRMMHAISKEYGFQYLVFLEIHLGLEPEELAKKEREIGFKYNYSPDAVKKFYSEARAKCKDLPYCVDLTKPFLGGNKLSLFLDVLHRNLAGHTLEAELIFEELKKRRLL